MLPTAEPKQISLVEKMKPIQEQWQKDMEDSLNPKQVCENCKIEISKWGCACGKQEENPKQETLEYQISL